MRNPLPHRLLWTCATLALGAALFAASGCGRRLTDANLDQVAPDMSRKEVESILGQPTSVKTHELTLQTQMKTLTATRYYYDQDGQKVELIFVADKLVGKNGRFNLEGALATRVAEKANSDQPIPGIDSSQLIMDRSMDETNPGSETTVEVIVPPMEELPLPEPEDGPAHGSEPVPDAEVTP